MVTIRSRGVALVARRRARLRWRRLSAPLAEVLPGLDAGRLPQGRPRQPFDRQPRPARARSGHRPGLRDGRAVPWTMAPAPTARSSSAPATKARSSGSTRRRQGPLFFDSAELEVHALAPAPDGGLFVATSPDGKITRSTATAQATTFFEPGREVHLGAGRRRKATLCGDGRERRRLQDRARRQGRAVLPAPRPRTPPKRLAPPMTDGSDCVQQKRRRARPPSSGRPSGGEGARGHAARPRPSTPMIHEDDDPDSSDVDARAARGLGVAADGHRRAGRKTSAPRR